MTVGAGPVYVRHPSQGRATLFRGGMAEVWGGAEGDE